MDRRVKYTKMIIRETFINLLEKKSINKITVSEICKEADINRATFYRYYLDVYDLYDKVRDEFVVKLMGSIKTNNNNNNNIYTVSSYSRGLLETLISDKKLTKILFNTSDGMGTFLNDILESEKNMSVNYTYALNEASNEELFKRIYDMFIHIKETQRNLFELSFKKGWYTLEKAEENKINEEINTLSNMFNEIK